MRFRVSQNSDQELIREAKLRKYELSIGRGERIRTSDLSVPNRAHYQAVLRPELVTAQLRQKGILLALRVTVKLAGCFGRDLIKTLAVAYSNKVRQIMNV
jgi:hypothetical protein